MMNEILGISLLLLTSFEFHISKGMPIEEIRETDFSIDSSQGKKRVPRWNDDAQTDVTIDLEEGSGEDRKKRSVDFTDIRDEISFQDDDLLPCGKAEPISTFEFREPENLEYKADDVEDIKVEDEDGHVIQETILHKRDTKPSAGKGLGTKQGTMPDEDYRVYEEDLDYPPGVARFGQRISDMGGVEDDLYDTNDMPLQPAMERNGISRKRRRRSVQVGTIEGPAQKRIVIDSIDTNDPNADVPAVVAVQVHKDSEAAGIESDLDDEIDMPLKPMEEPNTLKKQVTKEKLFPAPANIDMFLDKFDPNPKETRNASNENKMAENFLFTGVIQVTFQVNDSIPWKEPKMLTNCWAQAMLHTKRFSPSCNVDGSFSPKQCFLQRCWCVTRQGRPQILNKRKRFFYKVAGLLLACEQN